MTSRPADLVFTGGPVLTDAGFADSLAVRDGRIVRVGGESGDLRGPRTEVVDLHGRLLVPGFQDAHIHAVLGGVEVGECDLTGTVDLGEYLRRIDAYAKTNPDASWLTGGGWSMESFAGGVPERAVLDSVVPDRPVFLMNRDHHAAWVNSRALEIAGITAATVDPADGRIDRDADGTPEVDCRKVQWRWSPGGFRRVPPRID